MDDGDCLRFERKKYDTMTERICLLCKTTGPSKPENHLCNECLKPVKGISYTEQVFGIKISNHLMVKMNWVGRIHRLKRPDREDILQELSIRALEAKKRYISGSASLSTYVKTQIGYRAVDLARERYNASKQLHREEAFQIIEVDDFHRDHLNRRKSFKPLTMVTGKILEEFAADSHEHDIPEKIDIETIWPSLTEKQQRIVTFLEDGKTHQQIADRMGIRRSTVTRHVSRLKKKFEKLGKQMNFKCFRATENDISPSKYNKRESVFLKTRRLLYKIAI